MAERTRDTPSSLLIPEREDDLSTIAQKMEALERVVEKGPTFDAYSSQYPSIVAATDYTPQTQSKKDKGNHDPPFHIRKCFKPLEAKMYEAWEAGMTFPPLDWEVDVKDVGHEDTMRLMEIRAAAMNVVWKTNAATPEHAMWLTFNDGHALPLVKAVEKLLRAKKVKTWGVGALNEWDEYYACNYVMAMASQRLEEEWKHICELRDRINTSNDVTEAHVKHLESFVETNSYH